MRRHLLKKREESDPMGVVSNLFDVAMVFAVALMVALVTRYSMTEMFSQEDFTIVKNPGKEDMEIITKEGGKVRTRVQSPERKAAASESPTNSRTARSSTSRSSHLRMTASDGSPDG